MNNRRINRFVSLSLTRQHLLLVACGIFFWCPADPTRANPTGKNPNIALAVHGTVPEAKQLHAKLAALIVEAENFVTETTDVMNKRGPEAASAKKLLLYRGRTVLGSYESQRLARLGEPAAVDFEMRFQRTQVEIHALILKFIGTNTGQKARALLIAQLKKTHPAREKQLAQVRASLEKNDVAGAESIMDPIIAEIEGTIRFLYENEFEPYTVNYKAILAAFQQASLNKRTEDARKAYAAAIANNTVDVQAFKEWGKQVATQIASSGKADLGAPLNSGGTGGVDGPGALEQLKTQWLTAHARLQRLIGLSWAINSDDASKQDFVIALAGEYQAAALEVAKQIIEADAASIAASDVSGHYQRYMLTLSDLASSADTTLIETTFAAPLQKLLAKNSLFQQQVEQYRLATRDVFEFCQRQRDQALDTMQSKYSAADATIRKQVEAVNQQPGLLPAQSNPPMLATLMSPSNLTMATIGPKVINQVVSLQRIRSLAPEAKVEVASLDSRTYGSMLKVMLPAQEQSRIASLLLVDSSHPPLTMNAWHAMQCANRGNYDAAGGQIVGCQLEPVVARFASMPDTASTIVPLGAVGAASIGAMQLNQMMMRVDVVPQWVMYPLGFYIVPSAPTGAPAASAAAVPSAGPSSPPPTASPPVSDTPPVSDAPPVSSTPPATAPATNAIPTLPSLTPE